MSPSRRCVEKRGGKVKGHMGARSARVGACSRMLGGRGRGGGDGEQVKESEGHLCVCWVVGAGAAHAGSGTGGEAGGGGARGPGWALSTAEPHRPRGSTHPMLMMSSGIASSLPDTGIAFKSQGIMNTFIKQRGAGF